MKAWGMYLFDNFRFVNRIVSVHQPLNRSVPENSNGLGEEDRSRVFVVVQVGDGFLDNVRQRCLLHRMFQDPLNSDVAWLENSCTTARNIPDKNPGVTFLHPVAEFLRAMN